MRKFLRGTDGATAVEYALIATVIAVALIGSSQRVSSAVVDAFTCAAETLGVGVGMC